MGVMQLQNWDAFKKAVGDLAPTVILYSVEPDPDSTPSLNLRLVFYHGGNTYFYIDFPGGSYLRETKIPISISQKEQAHIEDKEVLRFLSDELKNTDFAALFDI